MRILSIVTLVFMFLVSGAIYANEPPDLEDIIESVSKAYSVEKLHSAKTVRLTEDIRRIYDSHDYGPDFHDFNFHRRHYVFNFEAQNGSNEYLTRIGKNIYHARMVLVDGHARFIDYGNGTFEDQGEQEYFGEYGTTYRASDVLLAYHLVKSDSNAAYKDSAVWLGRDYHLVTVELPNSPPLTIYIEQDTGYIGKMTRIVSNGRLISYTFDDHVRKNGIAIARLHSVFAGREPLYHSYNRSVDVNDRKDRKAFEIDKGIVEEPERTDQSALTIDRVAQRKYDENPYIKNVHHVGQNESYTTFVDTPMGLIALGTQAGFADRLTLYRKQTGNLLRLEYAMVADHHREATAGVMEATQSGATLLVTADSKQIVEDMFEDSELIPKIEVIDKPRNISHVIFVSAPTTHASQILFSYDLQGTFLYQHKHYASPYAEERSYAKHSAVTLMDAINNQNIAPDVILSGSTRKPETWEDFSEAVEAFDPTICFHNRPICG